MVGFFVFQVAGASAVSIRSPGKGDRAVGDREKPVKVGVLVCQKENCGEPSCEFGDFQVTPVELRRGQNMEEQPQM